MSDGAPAGSAFKATTLHAVLGDRSALTIGKLGLIGLKEIRAALGPAGVRWESRIQAAAETIIRKHLGPGDVCIELGADGYGIAFATLTPESAERKCASIAGEVRQWLLGTEGAEAITVFQQVAQLSAGNLRNQQGVRGAFADAFSGSTRAAVGAHRERQAGDPLAVQMSREPAQRPSGEGRNAGNQPSSAGRRRSESVTLHYEPIWDCRGEALLLFRPIPTSAAIAAPTPAIDLAALRCAHRDLAALAQKGKRIPVFLSVSARTIADSATRTVYLATLREIPAAIHRLMLVEVNMEDEQAEGALAAGFAERVRALGIGLALRCSLHTANVFAVKRLGARLATVDMSSVAGMDKHLLDRLERFAAAVAAAGLECGMLGVRSRSLTTAAATAGFRFLSGPDVHAPVTSLEDVLRYRPFDLFVARKKTAR